VWRVKTIEGDRVTVRPWLDDEPYQSAPGDHDGDDLPKLC
jgi:hypothetical protein